MITVLKRTEQSSIEDANRSLPDDAQLMTSSVHTCSAMKKNEIKLEKKDTYD